VETQRKETLLVQEQRDPRAYELMTILTPDMPEEDTAAGIERLLGYITAQNGEIKDNSTESPWGRRRLAYTMRFQGVDYRDGFYVLTHFSATPDVIGEIERELKLDTQVIRYLLVMDDPKMGEQHKNEPQAADDEEASDAPEAEDQIAETAEKIEGEENPAPANGADEASAETTSEEAVAEEPAGESADEPAEDANTDAAQETAGAAEEE